MRVLVCGLAGRLVGPALDRLDELIGVDEVMFQTSQRAAGVDVAASAWASANAVKWRLYRFDRKGAYLLAANPDIILMAVTTGRAMPEVRRFARALLIPVCIVDASGELRTYGRGWGSLLRAALGRQMRVMRRVG